MSEARFQEQVIYTLKAYGWMVYHTHDSRRSASGFPDLVAVHPKLGTIFAELKSDKGQPTAAQNDWLAALRGAGQQAYLWRPAYWDEVLTVASGGRV